METIETKKMSLREKQVAMTTRNEQKPVWAVARVRDRFLLKFVVVATNNSPSALAQKAGMAKSSFTRMMNNPVIHSNWSKQTLKKLKKVTNPIALQKITDASDLADYMTAVNKLFEFDPKEHVFPDRAFYDVIGSLQGNRWGPVFRLIMEEIIKEKEAPFPPKEGDTRPFR